MGFIKILDPITANQIAAGEVVERPASVVKELVENSLDAQSTSIEVIINDGGLQNIIVKDNGIGIYPEDMVVAFERHATSKIATAEDLSNLHSLGFRGEALPSIASVAKVELISRPRECTAGHKVTIHGGQVLGVEDVGCAPGTTVQVKELFFNTPARKKHLKSTSAEAAQITEVLTRLALAHPKVSFRLTSNGRQVLGTPGTGNLRDTIINLYGQEIGQELVEVTNQGALVKINGYIVRPVITRNNRHMQTIIVNGRYVRSKLISQGVLDAYHTLLPIGRHPVFVLDLQIDPSKVDANVHPTKMEIRFDEEDEIISAVREAVFSSLSKTNLVPGVSVNAGWNREAGGNNTNTSNSTVPRQVGQPKPKVEQGLLDWDSAQSISVDRYVDVAQIREVAPTGEVDPKGGLLEVDPLTEAESAIEIVLDREGSSKSDPVSVLATVNHALSAHETSPMYEKNTNLLTSQAHEQQDPIVELMQQEPIQEPTSEIIKPEPLIEVLQEQVVGQGLSCNKQEILENSVRHNWIAQLLPLGQVSGTYILCQGQDGLVIIDQHAAHERILYEEFMCTKGLAGFSQNLLIPITLELSPLEGQALIENILHLRDLGFILEHFGGNGYLVRAMPYWINEENQKETVLDILGVYLSEHKSLSALDLQEKTLVSMSCKAAIKAGEYLSLPIMEELILKLAKTAQPHTCPHGRPTMINMSEYDMERRFKRV